MISKNEFCHAINLLKAADESISKLETLCGITLLDSNIYFELENEIVKLLKDSFDDTEDWIGYYLWDTNFGKDWNNRNVVVDGVQIFLEKPEEFYEFLTKYYLKG